MQNDEQLKKAISVANTFLSSGRYNCEHPNPNGPKLSAEHYTYDVGLDEVAYEFPLKLGDSRCGYLLVSGTRRLPPILEYTTSGPPLRLLLEKWLSEHKLAPAKDVKWLYSGPMEIVAEYAHGAG